MSSAPLRVAVIDIGSNSTRLFVADVEEGRVDPIERRSTVTRLGRGVDLSGRLAAEAIEATCAAVDPYVATLQELGAERVDAIATSAVRCVGNTLILQGVVYSPPFRITAAGDPARLRAALAASRDIAIYRKYVRAYGLGYSVRTLSRAVLPAYTGNVAMKHATVPTEAPRGAH